MQVEFERISDEIGLLGAWDFFCLSILIDNVVIKQSSIVLILIVDQKNSYNRACDVTVCVAFLLYRQTSISHET